MKRTKRRMKVGKGRRKGKEVMAAKMVGDETKSAERKDD